jgi:hypothetical protein
MTVQVDWRWIGLVLVAVVLLALGMVAPVAAQGGGATPVPTPFWDENDDPNLNAQMDRVEEATSILRGLVPKEPVTRAFLTRDELLAYLTDLLDREYPAERALDDAIFYHTFGWMDLDTDLRQVQLDVLAEQIAGFYDTDLQAMFVISAQDELSVMNQILYAHEYTHVLQDQYFDLDAVDTDTLVIVAPDEALAYSALIEGDAMLMTEGYETWLMRSDPTAAFGVLGEGLLISSDQLSAAPPILQYELLFPYTYGRNFAYTLFTVGEGWRMVNEAYREPPQSTEQILHPERYVGGDQPVEVRVEGLAQVLGAGYRLVWNRSLGEFYLREMLRVTVPTETADAAAAGWGGDRYRIYFNDDTQQTVMIYRVGWDSPQDAEEFGAAFKGYGALRFADPGVVTDANMTCWYADVTLCLREGTIESVLIQVPDRAMIADVLPVLAPAR